MSQTKRTDTRAVVQGKVQFGTFDQPLTTVNLIESYEPFGWHTPLWFNRLRLKEWEAFQIISDRFFILGAIYQTHLTAFNLITVWDLEKKTLQKWQSFGNPFQLKMADQLNNSANIFKAGNFDLNISNQLEKGYCKIRGSKGDPKSDNPDRLKKAMSLYAEWNSCSNPSVVLMPLGKNKGLYTHKEVFAVKGQLQIGSEYYDLGTDAYGILDDHKGFYPYKMHYDWVTGFEKIGVEDWLCFNLTKNQALDPERHNENRLWVNGKQHRLPTVEFTHLENGDWRILDARGLVDLTFTPQQHMNIHKQWIVFQVDYHAPFGYFTGRITDPDGNIYQVKQATGMGEDKSYRL